MRVLLVEDEPRLSATLSRGLKAEGFVVVAVGTGVEGLREAIENTFDVVVLDMLPGHSGYEVLRRMRAQEVWTPVLMLTSKDGEYDQTDAFDLGADDYLTKPFSFPPENEFTYNKRDKPVAFLDDAEQCAASPTLWPARCHGDRGNSP